MQRLKKEKSIYHVSPQFTLNCSAVKPEILSQIWQSQQKNHVTETLGYAQNTLLELQLPFPQIHIRLISLKITLACTRLQMYYVNNDDFT